MHEMVFHIYVYILTICDIYFNHYFQQEKEELMELLSQMKELQVQEEQAKENPESDAAPADEEDPDEDDLEVDSTPMSEDDEASMDEDQEVPEVDADVVADTEPQEVKPDGKSHVTSWAQCFNFAIVICLLGVWVFLDLNPTTVSYWLSTR